VKAEHAVRREQHAGRRAKGDRLSLAEARARRTTLDWTTYTPPVPRFLGLKVIDDLPLKELARYIDWMPFFNAWEFSGTFPAILDDPAKGEAARALWKDAQQMLDRVLRERWLRARAVLGFFPANSTGDDVEVYAGADREQVAWRLHHLRQQKRKPPGRPQRCLADYMAPRGSGVPDFIGAFAVTAGIGIDEHVARFEAAHDDYSAILLKALADRLAEAAAEALHERVRREYWGYAPEERLDAEQLIREEYRGIRPAPGYPACPDHTEKATLWRMLDVERNAGIRLTESFAMLPTAAVSGWYFSHPEACYFAVGPIGPDQARDYAARKGFDVAEAERWLAPILAYDPAADAA
jgi:5-methyltetrahydrofolate--homocysteine methyltransferase